MQLSNKLKKRRKSISRPPHKKAPNTQNYTKRGVEIFFFVFQLGLTSQPASPSPRTSSTPGSTSTRYMYRIPLLLYQGLGSSGECTSSRTRNKTHHSLTLPPPLFFLIFSLSHKKTQKMRALTYIQRKHARRDQNPQNGREKLITCEPLVPAHWPPRA